MDILDLAKDDAGRAVMDILTPEGMAFLDTN